MENEIKVGDWIRTKDGRIYQVDSSNNEWSLSDIFYKVIVKHSPNLIALIEVGDYVNGYKVDNIEKGKLIIGDTTQVIEQIVKNNEIETVVTKEMMESVSYKVKQEEK